MPRESVFNQIMGGAMQGAQLRSILQHRRLQREAAERAAEQQRMQQQKAKHEELKGDIDQYKTFRDNMEGATGDLLLNKILTKFGMPEDERKAAIKDSRKNREAFDEYLGTIAEEEGLTRESLRGIFKNIPAEKRAEWLLDKGGKRRERTLGEALGQLAGTEARGGISRPTSETEPGDEPVGNIFRPFSDEQRRELRARQMELATQLQPGKAAEALIRPGGDRPLSGDQIYAQAAIAKFPDSREAQANYIRALRSNPESADNIIFQDSVRRHGGDIPKAAEELGRWRRQFAGERAGGAAEGQMEVRGTPEFQQTEQDVAQKRGFGGATGRRQVEAQEKLKDVAGTEQIIEDIAALSARVNKAQGGPGRFVQGAKKAAGGVLQTDLDAAELTNLRQSYSLSLARSILSERGVLTNQDRSYATNTFPSIWDTKGLANRKIARMRGLIRLQRHAEQQLSEGKPVDIEAFRKSWKRIATFESEDIPSPPRGFSKPIGQQ